MKTHQIAVIFFAALLIATVTKAAPAAAPTPARAATPAPTPKPKLPNTLTVHAKIKATSLDMLKNDNGTTSVFFGAAILDPVYSDVYFKDYADPSFQDFLKFDSNTPKYISPANGNCTLKEVRLEFLGPSQQGFRITAVDALNTSTCADFMRSILKSGLHMQFNSVSVASSYKYIQIVDVYLDL